MNHAFSRLRPAAARSPRARPASVPAAVVFLVLALTDAGWRGPALAQRDSATDALAGHQAEMRQLGEGADPLRRPLFFDPVDVENAPQGVPCDHLARRRPDVIAGEGAVVLMETIEPSPRRIRYWRPPGDNTAGPPQDMARAFALRQAGGRDIRLLGARMFLWCR